MKIVQTRKLIFINPFFLKKIYLFHKSFVFKFSEKLIYTRSSTIPYSYRFLTVTIYNGKKWKTKKLNRWIIGFKFGEFTWNRKIALYKAKQIKKKKLKKLKKLQKK